MADTDFLSGHAATKPDKPAVVFQGRAIDFESLNRRANRAANMFLALGCESDDRVAVFACDRVQLDAAIDRDGERLRVRAPRERVDVMQLRVEAPWLDR